MYMYIYMHILSHVFKQAAVQYFLPFFIPCNTVILLLQLTDLTCSNIHLWQSCVQQQLYYTFLFLT